MDLTNPTQIKDLLERHSFHFSKTFGQNFLITARIPEKIAEGAEIDESTTVLEIGPGIGCLTRCLAARAKKVVTVEIDDRLLPILQETLGDLSNVQVVHGDILKTDLNALLGNEEKLAVCANLPYNITTPILVYLLESGLSFESITVMVQKEVAQRFCAERGSKDYGAITLFLNYYTKPKMLFSVGAGNFLPKPRVDSAVLRLQAIQPPVDTPPEDLFRLIRAAFSMRRKTLQNTLASAGISKERTAAALEALNLPATTRGEELGLAEYAALARELDKTEQ
ncbi:MAG: 16S rRNA (adenine(1518)-N(6)/adenine(1519)-N(6))-dimethyltransferase RsmA [Clostridia bacterium]|nr:16S rRNA (adenine(1518)-N(6)/adenine(1519)-N(6))-dimethyltransferase RsmA [Clostridia bacterium]